MKTLKRTKLCLLASAIVAVGFGFTMKGVSAKAADEVGGGTTEPTITLEMGVGGSFRYEEPLGLGFLTRINSAEYDALEESYDVKTGTIFVRKADVEAAEITLNNDTFTLSEFAAVGQADLCKEIPNEGWLNTTDTHYEFRGSVVNMKEANVTKDYCARGYVAYKDSTDANAEWTYKYTDYVDDDHCRSIQEIAIKAMEDTQATQEGVYQYPVTTELGTVYSRFTEAQRNSISKYVPYEQKDLIKGLTAQTATQYSMKDREGAFLTGNEVSDLGLEGGYTGAAVQFPAANKDITINFPAGQENFTSEESTDGLYFTVWVALHKTGTETLTGDFKLENTDGYLFRRGTLKYARNNNKITLGSAHIEWNNNNRTGAAISYFELNTWYQLYIPLGDVVTANTTGVLNMFHCVYGTAGNVEAQCNFLVGNIGVATQTQLNDVKAQATLGILNGLTEENYAQYKRNGNSISTYYTKDQWAETYTHLNNDNGYTGNAVASAGPANTNTFAVDITENYLPASGTFYIWVAVVTENGYASAAGERWRAYNNVGIFGANFSTGDSGAAADWSGDFKFNTWYKLERDASKATIVYDASLGGYKLLAGTQGTNWTASNYTILIGDFGVEA